MGIINVAEIFDKNLMPGKDDYCVYSLLDTDKTIIYVGQSSNLRQRIFAHLSSDKEFDYVEWCICKKDEANNLEADGIVKAKTHANKVLPKNDLYMVVGGMKREMMDKLTETTNKFDFVFESVKGSKYISKEDYDLAMRMFDDLNSELLDRLQK